MSEEEKGAMDRERVAVTQDQMVNKPRQRKQTGDTAKGLPLWLLEPIDNGQRLCVGGFARHIAHHFTTRFGGLSCAHQVEQQSCAIREGEENGALKHTTKLTLKIQTN